MKITVIYHSHSGKTRTIAEKIHHQLGGDLIEVVPNQQYSTLSAVTKGCYRALTGTADSVTPDSIALGDTDLVVFACPVWAGKPTPVMNGALKVLSGESGKRAFLIVTCNDAKSGGQAIALLKSRVSDVGMVPAGEGVLDKHTVISDQAITPLIEKIRLTGGKS
ncbi:MAG TPA: NAD(P)H-dependent oxidoreductase [Methanospirillum sp.]|uniref:flavodoxin family protein n=1 Tax=Methanospirillum sp. TaxID=45200 RepID=UPI002C021085|nr:NAD(P)H-dependent oxidoreductase [Methanospirillum sp.]HWQ63415.1 NAD(P)H-dependent oxidoreductase [Methanospirillum sp.]